jgi:predicted transcriptional regulator
MFSTEKEMVELLSSKMEAFTFGVQLYGDTYMQQFEEVNLGHGIADLVVTHVKSCGLDRNEPLGKLDINIYIIFETNKNWLSPIDIQEITRTSQVQINKSLNRLNKEGFIEKGDCGRYKFKRLYRSNVSTSIAIEAKLSNWKRALKQAYRYNWFSHYSYVVLPKNKISSPKKNIILFHQMKVGLASIDDQGEIEVIYNPRRARPFNRSMEYLLNESLLHQWLKKAEPCT